MREFSASVAGRQGQSAVSPHKSGEPGPICQEQIGGRLQASPQGADQGWSACAEAGRTGGLAAVRSMPGRLAEQASQNLPCTKKALLEEGGDQAGECKASKDDHMSYFYPPPMAVAARVGPSPGSLAARAKRRGHLVRRRSSRRCGHVSLVPMVESGSGRRPCIVSSRRLRRCRKRKIEIVQAARTDAQTPRI